MKLIWLLLLSFLIFSSAFSQSKQQFSISLYWPPELYSKKFDTGHLNLKDLSNFTRMKECYFDLLIDGMQFFPSNSSPNGYKLKDYYLALTKATGLKAMLGDVFIAAFNNPELLVFDKSEFVTLYSKFSTPNYNNTVYGIYLGDEPRSGQQLDVVRRWASFFRKSYPKQPTFVNLLPVYAFKTDKDYESYLIEYSKSDPYSPIVSFNHYPFRVNMFNSNFFLDSYFYNLYKVRSIFKTRALWATVHSVKGDGNITDPNEHQLRFMAFCPIAYGALGISYWPYKINSTVSYLHSSIDNDNEKYRHVQNINHYLRDIVAPVITENRLIATLHQSNTSLNKNYPFSSNQLINKSDGIIRDVNNKDVLIGVFSSNDLKLIKTPGYYVWLVNKNTEDAIFNLTVTIQGNYVNRVRLSPTVVGYHKSARTGYTLLKGSVYNRTTNETFITIPQLAPGEGRMMQLVHE